MRPMRTGHRLLNTARKRAIWTQGTLTRGGVYIAGPLCADADFAQPNISAPIGLSGTRSAAPSVGAPSGIVSWRLWRHSAASVFAAALMTRAFSTLTTRTQPVRTARHIGAFRTHRGSCCGSVSGRTFNCSAPTATASRRMSRRGEPASLSQASREPRYFDIACRRIEEAQRQGDMFRDAVA